LIDNGKLEDTVIIFQMDHGVPGKGLLFENGVRIAQFVHYPKMFGTNGIKFDGMVSTIDIGPSMLHLAGINISSDGYYGMDGKSWAEAVAPQTEQTKFERCIFTEMNHDRAVRCGCYKMVNFDQSKYSKTIENAPKFNFPIDDVMLFDLCDKYGNYTSYPNLSPETINCYNTTCKNKVKPLTKILNCFIKKTSPKNEDFDRVCVNKQKNNCKDIGISCNKDKKCCSGSCNLATGVCEDDCKYIGRSCSNDNKCCSGSCTRKKCAYKKENNCKDSGKSCKKDKKCCSGSCNLATGVCEDACKDIGRSCSNDNKCCSGSCTRKGSFDKKKKCR